MTPSKPIPLTEWSQAECRATYHLPHHIEAQDLPLHDDMRIATGWEAFAVGPPDSGAEAVLHWDDAPIQSDPVRLRLTVGCDMREAKTFELFLAKTNTPLTRLEIRFGNVFQPHEVELSADQARAVMAEGLRIRMIEGTTPLWFFKSGPDRFGEGIHPLLPHLLTDCEGDPRAQFFQRLLSGASLHPFGWMEGCVLDGLLAMEPLLGRERVRPVLESHFAQFFDQDRKLRYENPRGRPVDDTIYGIEGTLPYAILGRIDPTHPVLDKVREFFALTRDHEGSVQGHPHRAGKSTTCEGCYTVAYPMAVLAELDDSEEGRRDALHQLLIRERRLFTEDGIHLRFFNDEGRTWHTLLNWSRGIAWYLLGFVRCLEIWGPDRYPEATRAFVRAVDFVMQRQLDNGLWSCFVDAPEITPDTSGSAGIAAAVTVGCNLGVLPETYRASARRTMETVMDHFLTPDGFLEGAAQGNKGGEELQRSDYRVIYQMGMGLLAQLLAAQATAGREKD